MPLAAHRVTVRRRILSDIEKGELMPAGPLRVVARIKAKSEAVSEVRELLCDLIEPTRKESGCISYELLQNRDDPTDFTFVEEWEKPRSAAHVVTFMAVRAPLNLSVGQLNNSGNENATKSCLPVCLFRRLGTRSRNG